MPVQNQFHFYYMKSIILLFSFFISLSFFACVDDSSSIGAKWVQSSFLNEQMDTCTVLLSTVLSDSIATSGDTVCQIGYRDDNLWGKITASFYAEYEVPSYSFDENIQYEFDSITIRLYSSGNYLGDTLKTQRIHLHELTKNIELDDRGYNTTLLLPITTKLHWHLSTFVLLRAHRAKNWKYDCRMHGEKNGST